MNSHKLEQFAGRIRKHRLVREMTQAEVSEKAGIDVTTYSRFERTGNITLARLVNVLMALGLESEFNQWVKEPHDQFRSIDHALRTVGKPRKRVRKAKRK